MLQNAYFLAKIGADTAENEQHFAEILPKTGNYPTGPRGVAEPARRRARRRGAAEPRGHVAGLASRDLACTGARTLITETNDIMN